LVGLCKQQRRTTSSTSPVVGLAGCRLSATRASEMAEAKDGALWKMGRLLGKELVIAFVH